MLLKILIFLGAFAGMEAGAYVTHKYVMHGFLWNLHKDHHEPRTGFFEKNDWFVFVFMIPPIVLIWFGTNGHPLLLAAGLGVTAYGAAYFTFHDIIVHRRISIRYKPRTGYMRRIIEAHWIHHARREKEGCVSFGFLYAPPIDKLLAQSRAHA